MYYGCENAVEFDIAVAGVTLAILPIDLEVVQKSQL